MTVDKFSSQKGKNAFMHIPHRMNLCFLISNPLGKSIMKDYFLLTNLLGNRIIDFSNYIFICLSSFFIFLSIYMS